MDRAGSDLTYRSCLALPSPIQTQAGQRICNPTADLMPSELVYAGSPWNACVETTALPHRPIVPP